MDRHNFQEVNKQYLAADLGRLMDELGSGLSRWSQEAMDFRQRLESGRLPDTTVCGFPVLTEWNVD